MSRTLDRLVLYKRRSVEEPSLDSGRYQSILQIVNFPSARFVCAPFHVTFLDCRDALYTDSIYQLEGDYPW